MLNSFAGKCLFHSGVSFGSGLTSILDEKEENGLLYIDTPGLTDDKLRKQSNIKNNELISF